MEKVDRYSVLERSFDELPATLEHAQALGLQYLVMNGNGRKTARVYIFFDQAGLIAYLSGQYSRLADDVHLIINGDAPAEDKVSALDGILGNYNGLIS